MNLLHRWYCRSDGWGNLVARRIIPWTLDGVPLGDHPLEIGPGPGLTTNVLRGSADRLTCIEIDPRLAAALAERMEGSNPSTSLRAGVRVVVGDATQMPFPDGSFSGAVCLTMLHHVPSRELQNRLLAEVRRVLRPGGWFAGTDNLTSLGFRLFHLFDTCEPVDPASLGRRLEDAGFVDVDVDTNPWAFRFRARRPAT